jgi:hypothetical protein
VDVSRTRPGSRGMNWCLSVWPVGRVVHPNDTSKFSSFSFYLVSWCGVRLSPLGTAATNWPIVPAPDDRWVWIIWRNDNWQGKPKYSEKTAPVPLCPPQIPHDVTCARTRAVRWEAGYLPPELWRAALELSAYYTENRSNH